MFTIPVNIPKHSRLIKGAWIRSLKKCAKTTMTHNPNTWEFTLNRRKPIWNTTQTNLFAIFRADEGREVFWTNVCISKHCLHLIHFSGSTTVHSRCIRCHFRIEANRIPVCKKCAHEVHSESYIQSVIHQSAVNIHIDPGQVLCFLQRMFSKQTFNIRSVERLNIGKFHSFTRARPPRYCCCSIHSDFMHSFLSSYKVFRCSPNLSRKTADKGE